MQNPIINNLNIILKLMIFFFFLLFLLFLKWQLCEQKNRDPQGYIGMAVFCVNFFSFLFGFQLNFYKDTSNSWNISIEIHSHVIYYLVVGLILMIGRRILRVVKFESYYLYLDILMIYHLIKFMHDTLFSCSIGLGGR